MIHRPGISTECGGKCLKSVVWCFVYVPSPWPAVELGRVLRMLFRTKTFPWFQYRARYRFGNFVCEPMFEFAHNVPLLAPYSRRQRHPHVQHTHFPIFHKFHVQRSPKRVRTLSHKIHSVRHITIRSESTFEADRSKCTRIFSD